MLKLRKLHIAEDVCYIAGVAQGKRTAGVQLGRIAEEVAVGGLTEHDGTHGNFVLGNIREKPVAGKSFAGEEETVGIHRGQKTLCVRAKKAIPFFEEFTAGYIDCNVRVTEFFADTEVIGDDLEVFPLLDMAADAPNG